MVDRALATRTATAGDLSAITRIYNEGIEDRIATLEVDSKSEEDVSRWLFDRPSRYEAIVALSGDDVVGWAALNPYSHRCAYAAVADLSVYVARTWRGKGVGEHLLRALEARATAQGFHKIVLFTFPFNGAGQRLYRKCGFREVGIFKEQGVLDEQRVDVMAMEKILGG